MLRRLLANTTIRARIIDPDGNLVVDSRFLYGRGDIIQIELAATRAADAGNRPQRLWNSFIDWALRYDYPLQTEYGLDNGKDFPEVAAALNGASVSVVRLNDRGADHRAGVGAGAALPGRARRAGAVDHRRRDRQRAAGRAPVVFFTFGFVALVTMLLSVLLAGTIAEPIRAARGCGRAGAARHQQARRDSRTSPRARDEIGHLSGALRDMTTRSTTASTPSRPSPPT